MKDLTDSSVFGVFAEKSGYPEEARKFRQVVTA